MAGPSIARCRLAVAVWPYNMRRIQTLIREIVGFVLRFSGMTWILRDIVCRKKVAILVYHRPSAETFKAHIEYLKRHYNLISLNTLLNAIENGNSSDIPAKALVVTLDDGHKSNHGLMPIIKEFNIRPTMYVCSHLIGTNRHFWWLEVPSVAVREIKRLPINRTRERLRLEFGYEIEKEYPDRQALTDSEIAEMEPYVDLGAHSKFHTILSLFGDKECTKDLRDSKTKLEALLGRPVAHFAYPNGDHGEREVEYLKSCGYRSARTLDVGWNTISTDPYRLKAIGVEDNASINILCGQLTGLFAYFKYLCHGSFRGMRPPLL